MNEVLEGVVVGVTKDANFEVGVVLGLTKEGRKVLTSGYRILRWL